MIVTVEEAKTKRCQEGFAASKGVTVRAVDPPVPAYSQAVALSMGLPMAGAGMVASTGPEQGPTAPFFCLGPDCMAWKWLREMDPHNEFVFTDARTIDGELLGYCGKVRG